MPFQAAIITGKATTFSGCHVGNNGLQLVATAQISFFKQFQDIIKVTGTIGMSRGNHGVAIGLDNVRITLVGKTADFQIFFHLLGLHRRRQHCHDLIFFKNRDSINIDRLVVGIIVDGIRYGCITLDGFLKIRPVGNVIGQSIGSQDVAIEKGNRHSLEVALSRLHLQEA